MPRYSRQPDDSRHSERPRLKSSARPETSFSAAWVRRFRSQVSRRVQILGPCIRRKRDGLSSAGGRLPTGASGGRGSRRPSIFRGSRISARATPRAASTWSGARRCGSGSGRNCGRFSSSFGCGCTRRGARPGNGCGPVVEGYYRYHAAPGKTRTLAGFRRVVSWLWLKTLLRRGDKRRMSWQRFYRLDNRYLPKPRICHPFPSVRFAAMHPR